MSLYSTEISVKAYYNELRGLMAELGMRACLLGMAEEEVSRVQMVIEELFVNTISHGHGTECTAPIHIYLSRHSDGVTITYIDDARPFDLTEYTCNADDGDTVGGIGLALVQRMSKSIRHERRDDMNITELEF